MGKGYDDWTIQQLQFALRERGLSANGKKRVLIDRLKGRSNTTFSGNDNAGGKPSSHWNEKVNCPLCSKTFSRINLFNNRGVCNSCYNDTCNCSVCNKENIIGKMIYITDKETIRCSYCYFPRLVSYLAYIPLLFIFNLLFINSVVTVIILIICAILFFSYVLQENPFTLIGGFHDFVLLGPTTVNKSAKISMFLAILLIGLLFASLFSPWFVYNVEYRYYSDAEKVAFSQDYYFDRVDIHNFDYNVWRGHYLATDDNLQNLSALSRPWYYDEDFLTLGWNGEESITLNYNSPTYDEHFNHRQELIKQIEIIIFISISFLSTAAATAFVLSRATSNLEPNFLELKRKENFQKQIALFVKKVKEMRYQNIDILSLMPHVEELKQVPSPLTTENEKLDKNPILIMKTFTILILIGLIISTGVIFYFAESWIDVSEKDNVALQYCNENRDKEVWNIASSGYNFRESCQISTNIEVLFYCLIISFIITISHSLFMYRASYGKVEESKKLKEKIEGLKGDTDKFIEELKTFGKSTDIPSANLNDIEESVPVEEEEPLTTTELPDPGEGLLLDEAVESEEESVDDEN